MNKTNIERRRFLQIVAAASAFPATGFASQVHWQGFAFGAEVSIKLFGDGSHTQYTIDAAVERLRSIENTFSIYDPTSELSKLNRTGRLVTPSQDFQSLISDIDTVHKATGGLFDPTVQRIFEARVGKVPFSIKTAAGSTGWQRMRRLNGMFEFIDPKMRLTFNGIAQGFATDEVRNLLSEEGFKKTLVNIGEYAAGDQRSRIGIADHTGDIFDIAEIKDEAIATSSPGGYRFRDGSSHIISPDGSMVEPIWRTVSVVADTATKADGFSTALVLAPNEQLARNLKNRGLVKKVFLQNHDKKVTVI